MHDLRSSSSLNLSLHQGYTLVLYLPYFLYIGVFIFGAIIYPNNTAVILEHIGDEDKNLFICTTSHTSCCQTGVQGNFYYPNRVPVLSLSEASSPRRLYQARNHGSISLKQKPGEAFPPLGRYRCEIPDGRGILQNLFFTIGEASY